jgi:aspartate/methionine/tyrosine aminotransferase
MVDEFKKRRDYIVKRLCEIDGFSGEPPKGAFYYFPRFEFGMNSQEFSEFLLNKAHVVVTPGSVFGTNGEHHVRISFSTSMEQIKKGVEKIEECVKSLF